MVWISCHYNYYWLLAIILPTTHCSTFWRSTTTELSLAWESWSVYGKTTNLLISKHNLGEPRPCWGVADFVIPDWVWAHDTIPVLCRRWSILDIHYADYCYHRARPTRVPIYMMDYHIVWLAGEQPMSQVKCSKHRAWDRLKQELCRVMGVTIAI